MKKSLRIISMSSFADIANRFPDGYYAIYSPQMTILILDKNKKHRGSIFLKEEIPTGETKISEFPPFYPTRDRED